MIIPLLGTCFKDGDIPDILLQLGKKGYLRFKVFRVTSCDGRLSTSIVERLEGCGHSIKFSIRKSEDFIPCHNCGNEYFFNELQAKSDIIKEIVDIDYRAIIEDINNSIKEQGIIVTNLDGYEGNFTLKIDSSDDEYLLVFSGGANNQSGILSATERKSGVIFIQISEISSTILPETAIVISGVEILLNGFGHYKDILRALPKSNEVIDRLRRVRQVENEIILASNVITWQAVENEVANFFINEIRSRVVAKYKYRILLEQFPHFARIPVNAAGAGNADKVTINLSDYLEELFEADFTTDVKCYTSTTVDYKTMEKVLHHLSKNPFDAKRVIIVATTNNVTCWDDVKSFKDATGNYRLIIFTARLIAELAVNLGFEEEFKKVLRESIVI